MCSDFSLLYNDDDLKWRDLITVYRAHYQSNIKMRIYRHFMGKPSHVCLSWMQYSAILLAHWLGIRHLNEIKSPGRKLILSVCGGCWGQELGLTIYAKLLAKTVMESHCSLALHWNYFSWCQDFTVYPHMSPRVWANPSPLRKLLFSQHCWDSGKGRRIHPAMTYADPLALFKTALTLFPCWTALKIKRETPPIKDQGLKVRAVESRPQKGTLRIQQQAQPHQLENQLRHAWRQLTRDLLRGGWSCEVWGICHFPLWPPMRHSD